MLIKIKESFIGFQSPKSVKILKSIFFKENSKV